MSARWTEDEIDVLMRHYCEHGPKWDGWGELLPERTRTSIISKACSLNLRCDPLAIVRDYGMEPAISAEIAVAALDDATRLRLMLLLRVVT